MTVSARPFDLCDSFFYLPPGVTESWSFTRNIVLQSMLKYDSRSQEVQLVTERDYQAGEAITAWFGPQPNQRTFLNYGIVDENNPHDKLSLSVRASTYKQEEFEVHIQFPCPLCNFVQSQ